MVQEIHQVLKKYLKPAVLKGVYIMNGKTLEQLACEINAKVDELNPVVDKQELFEWLIAGLPNASVKVKFESEPDTGVPLTPKKWREESGIDEVKLNNVKLDEEKEDTPAGEIPAASPDSETSGEAGTEIQE